MHINYEAAELVLPGWWCWWLLLHVIPYRLAYIDAGPDLCTLCPDLCTFILTFGPCACGVSLLSTGANIPLAQVVVVAQLQLALVVPFHLATSANRPLALVVLFHPATGANTAFALRQPALCGGGLWWLTLYNSLQSQKWTNDMDISSCQRCQKEFCVARRKVGMCVWV